MIQKKRAKKVRHPFDDDGDDDLQKVKDIFSSSRTTMVMGKDNASLLRKLHCLALDMTGPGNYLVHWIDYLPFDGPHEATEQNMKVGGPTPKSQCVRAHVLSLVYACFEFHIGPPAHFPSHHLDQY